MSVLTQTVDLEVVFNDISAMSKIDKENIFLCGHSFGGLVSTCAAMQMKEQVKGLVLVEPSYQMPNLFKQLYHEFTGDVRATMIEQTIAFIQENVNVAQQ